MVRPGETVAASQATPFLYFHKIPDTTRRFSFLDDRRIGRLLIPRTLDQQRKMKCFQSNAAGDVSIEHLLRAGILQAPAHYGP